MFRRFINFTKKNYKNHFNHINYHNYYNYNNYKDVGCIDKPFRKLFYLQIFTFIYCLSSIPIFYMIIEDKNIKKNN